VGRKAESMRTEKIVYESGDITYVLVMSEASNRVAMERRAAIQRALAESQAAGDDPDKGVLADRRLVYASLCLLIVAARAGDRDIPCPMTFDSFLDLPQQLTDTVLTAANRRLNPQWFEVEPDAEAQKKAA
jgi:hypothetical protein